MPFGDLEAAVRRSSCDTDARCRVGGNGASRIDPGEIWERCYAMPKRGAGFHTRTAADLSASR
jgi:hypothetical protein